MTDRDTADKTAKDKDAPNEAATDTAAPDEAELGETATDEHASDTPAADKTESGPGRALIPQAQLNADGGSRGNPGDSGIGFTITVDEGSRTAIVCRGGAYIGQATNNVAEYRALIWGLQNACALGVVRLDVCLDSELLVKQLSGEYRVKNEGIRPLYNEALHLLEGFAAHTVKHIPRELNSEADRLANKAMDTQGMVGDYVVNYETGDLFSASGNEPGLTSPCQSVDDKGTVLVSSHCHSEPFAEAQGKLREESFSAPKPRSSGVYKLTVKDHFDAAHALVGYPGECKDLHGHTWDIEATIQGTELDEVGIVYDFKNLKADLSRILSRYDHVYLNEVSPFNSMNATAENLARVIYEQLEDLLPSGIDLVEVAVWESPIARLSYSK